jgi:hypothetical protein
MPFVVEVVELGVYCIRIMAVIEAGGIMRGDGDLVLYVIRRM